MPTFKVKNFPKKIKLEKSNITLDKKHSEFVSGFQNDKLNIIPSLKKERAILLNKLKSFEIQQNTNVPNNNIEDFLDIKDKIRDINNQIKKLNNNQKKYYLNNSKYIFEYFENKKNISDNCSNQHQIQQSQSQSQPQIKNTKTKILNDFFKIKPSTSSSSQEQSLQTIPEESKYTEKIDDHNNIIKKYLYNVDCLSIIDLNNYIKLADICGYCHRGELIPNEDDGFLVCNSCFKNSPYLIENEKPSYKEPPKEVCFYAYKKINHFKEILAQFQGKETTQIPEIVLENIIKQIKKERITLNNLTYNKTKEILKKLGYNKYYEHIAFIKNKLGIKPIIMSPELEEKLCNLFIEIQSPYAKHVPDSRVNFLNYYYVLYKLCELLEETSYLEHIPMLKDNVKLMEQDFVWHEICKELDWEFIPSIINTSSYGVVYDD